MRNFQFYEYRLAWWPEDFNVSWKLFRCCCDPPWSGGIPKSTSTKRFFLSTIRLTTASIMKTGTIILFRLVIWFRKTCFIKRTKFLLAYINIRVKLDRNNENSIGECEILQIDGFFRKVIRRTYHTIWDRNLISKLDDQNLLKSDDQNILDVSYWEMA